ncbi:MAG: peptidoglycan editing factor PgeF [Betaproteobacteria bacterium]
MSTTLSSALIACDLDWIVPIWGGPSRVRAMFTTRRSGVHADAATSFNLGSARPASGTNIDAVTENRRRLRELLPADPVWLQQVHGIDVVEIGAVPEFPLVADAAVTRLAETVLTVRTADCLPVLLANRAGTVLAVAHAGWRGLAAGVLENVVSAMGAPADEISAWIGPGIGAQAFEVGPDVVAAFGGDATAFFQPQREGKWMADLAGLARQRLTRVGLCDIAGGQWCTHTDAARFFSYRRDKDAGRMALVAWLAR